MFHRNWLRPARLSTRRPRTRLAVERLEGRDVPSTISVSGTTLSEIGSPSAFITAGSGGLDAPVGIALGPDGNVYVACNGGAVRRYDGTTGAYISTFVTQGSGGLSGPDGLAFSPDGNLYVASLNTDQVLRYDGTTGAFMDLLVGPGDGRTTGPRALEFKAKIAMCHRPPGDPDHRATITIGYLSARDHVDHGDAVGPCPPQ